MAGGIAFGQLFAGIVGSALNWRAPFLLIAFPSLFCGAAMYFTVEEPKRGDQEVSVIASRNPNIIGEELTEAGLEVMEFESCANMPGSEKSCHRGDKTAKHFGYETSEMNSIGSKSSGSSPTASDVGDISNEVDRSNESLRRNQRDSFFSSPSSSYSSSELSSSSAAASHTVSAETSTVRDNGKEVVYSEKIEWAKVKIVLRTPTAIMCFFQGIPGCCPWGLIYVFLNDYFRHGSRPRLTVPFLLILISLTHSYAYLFSFAATIEASRLRRQL